jgi:hypothetical protein
MEAAAVAERLLMVAGLLPLTPGAWVVVAMGQLRIMRPLTTKLVAPVFSILAAVVVVLPGKLSLEPAVRVARVLLSLGRQRPLLQRLVLRQCFVLAREAQGITSTNSLATVL